MRSSTFRLPVGDGVSLFVYRFDPEGAPKAVVQIAHGMAEHAGRYARLAAHLVTAGYAVYASDHRGHGQTVMSPNDLGHFADEGGWQKVVEDLYALQRRIVEEHPGVPLFFFGHSMGSMLLQDFLFTHAAGLAGAVMSGTSGGAAALAKTARVIAKGERLRLGKRGRSALLQKLSFGSYNKRFAPTRTEFDWLSRDAVEVDKYIADPLCGFDITVQGWVDVLDGVVRIGDEANIRRVPLELPIYLFSGSRDPVGNDTRGVRWLIDAYTRAGLKHVTHRFYPEGRHEMLNEVNRSEVHDHVLQWFEGVLASGR